MMSRRAMLQAAGLVGVGAVLAACTEGGGGGGATGGAVGGGDVTNILDYIGPVDTKFSGKGLTLPLGAALAFSGPGSIFGELQGNGAKLAISHIKKLGGPAFKLVTKDIRSGDPVAGVEAVREFASEKVAMVLSSYIGDLGSMQGPLAQNKILALDGGGGTGVFAQSADYFWGMRAVNANDNFAGVVKFVKETFPKAKKISSVCIDQGPANKLVKGDGDKAIADGGLTPGVFLTSPAGTTDWGTILQQLRSDEPDVIWAQIVGDDPGYFMKQYATSGLKAPVFIFEYTQPAADIAGSAYNGVYFAFDYFDASKPYNDWTKIFIADYKKTYGKDPEYYAANYYEDTFAFWDLVRRVLAAGGDTGSGEQLQAALVADPKFHSLYGGKGSTTGTITLDTTTHTVTSRQLAISRYENGKITVLRYSDIGGKDYRKA